MQLQGEHQCQQRKVAPKNALQIYRNLELPNVRSTSDFVLGKFSTSAMDRAHLHEAGSNAHADRVP